MQVIQKLNMKIKWFPCGNDQPLMSVDQSFISIRSLFPRAQIIIICGDHNSRRVILYGNGNQNHIVMSVDRPIPLLVRYVIMAGVLTLNYDLFVGQRFCVN